MNDTDTPITYKLKRLVRRAVCESLEYEGFYNDAEVSVTFTDNEGIRALNSEYRGIDKETDVLSFPLTDFEGSEEPPADEAAISLGDIVVSLEKARTQAEEFGHSFQREVAFLCRLVKINVGIFCDLRFNQGYFIGVQSADRIRER